MAQALIPSGAQALTTEQLAARLGLQPHTLRAAVCRTGSYYGLKPTKCPNGRLLWPADAFERLTKQHHHKQVAA